MYPHINLTRSIRLTIMLVLICCFFVVSPILIMYTAGYRYDLQTKQIKQTGVISIDTAPRDANVFLNDVLINKKIPIRLANRAPGAYTIKFTKPGYHDWQKEITVESKKTVYLKNITLFKNNLPVAIIDKLKYPLVDAAFSADGAYALFTAKIAAENNTGDIYEINLLETDSKKITTLLRTDSAFPPLISWSLDNNFALIQTNNRAEYNLDLLDANNPEKRQSFSYYAPIKAWQWSKNNFSPEIYIQIGNKLKALNDNREREISSNSSALWYLDTEENIWNYDNDTQQLTKNGFLNYELQNPEKIKSIINIDRDRIILLGNNNIFVIAGNGNKEKQMQVLPAQKFYFNPGTKEWLSWSSWELWTIYENGGAALLTRTSEKMEDVLPMDEFGVLLLQSENNLKGFNPGYYIIHELLNGVKIKKAGVDAKNRKIFFWGEMAQKEGLYELEY